MQATGDTIPVFDMSHVQVILSVSNCQGGVHSLHSLPGIPPSSRSSRAGGWSWYFPAGQAMHLLL